MTKREKMSIAAAAVLLVLSAFFGIIYGAVDLTPGRIVSDFMSDGLSKSEKYFCTSAFRECLERCLQELRLPCRER